MREHRRDVEPAVADQLEVERDGVEAAPLEVLHAEGVGAGDGDLLEVDRGRLPSLGRGHAGVDEPAPLGQDAHAHLEGLGLGDGVVDDVDVPGMGHGQPVQGWCRTAPDQAASSSTSWSRGSWAKTASAPKRSRHGALGLEAGDHADLDARVERLEDGHAGQAEGAGAVDEHPPRRGRRVAHDGVEGDREGIGQDGGLVGDAVGHRDQHGVVRRQLLGPGAGRAGDDADVHAGAEVALGEAPAQAEVAGLAGRAQRRRCRVARRSTTG